MKTVSLNIVMTYPVRWSTYQILRDFAQNFYDAIGYDEWYQRFHYDHGNCALSMWVDGVSFNYEWLMHIGASTKTSNSGDNAGFFGEGFKIASLCAVRDKKWKIQMMSDDWHIDVIETDQLIDQTKVKMLAYNISTVEKNESTRLIIENFTVDDYELFKTVIDSFYSPDNPIMGKRLWMGKEGAVFLRSNCPINSCLPYTYDFGRKGAVFCGYQMLGTNPFNLVVCLHRYKKEDRERKSLYSFNVIGIFEDISGYVDPECAMVMLEKMKRYWNTYPQKRLDIHSWSNTINILIRRVSLSEKVKKVFLDKYNNLLCAGKVYSIGERNRRWQAKAWLNLQSKRYILVKRNFTLLGYPMLEEECERNGGFVADDNADDLQKQCFNVLENVCREAFQDFFDYREAPERKIITNPRSAYHGMASQYRKLRPAYNNKGMMIRYDIERVYLKCTIFCSDGYYDGLSTYLHEMCHMFGGDSSASFSKALTYVTELLLEEHEQIEIGKSRWEKIFVECPGS